MKAHIDIHISKGIPTNSKPKDLSADLTVTSLEAALEVAKSMLHARPSIDYNATHLEITLQ